MEGVQGKESCNNNDFSFNTYPSEEKKKKKKHVNI